MPPTLFQPGFGASQQRNRWWRDQDGAWATTTPDEREPVLVKWSLIDALDTGVTVSSAAYEDSGSATSGKSVATPVVNFTMTGYGETKVTLTLSAGGPLVMRFRVYPTKNSPAFLRDYR